MSDTLEKLPDSRLKRLVAKVVPHKLWGMAQKIYCAHCGHDGGWIPEQNSTFAFYLCDECWESHGHLTGLMSIPESEVRRAARLRELERSSTNQSVGELQC